MRTAANVETHLIILHVLGQGLGQICAMRCVRGLRKRSGDRYTLVPMPMRREDKRTSSFAPTSCNVSESAAYCCSPLRAEARERGESTTAATGPAPAATRSKALAENCARARIATRCKNYNTTSNFTIFLYLPLLRCNFPFLLEKVLAKVVR